jgi:hypothetical protein
VLAVAGHWASSWALDVSCNAQQALVVKSLKTVRAQPALTLNLQDTTIVFAVHLMMQQPVAGLPWALQTQTRLQSCCCCCCGRPLEAG